MLGRERKRKWKEERSREGESRKLSGEVKERKGGRDTHLWVFTGHPTHIFRIKFNRVITKFSLWNNTDL